MKTFFASFAFFALLCCMGCESLQGPPGPMGPRGEPGMNGSNGANGSPGPAGSGLVTEVQCAGNISVGTSTYYIKHGIYTFSDRSVMATCEVSGTGSQVTGIGFYKETQNGAAIGACLVTADIDTASFGFWDFNYRGGGTTTATYRDAPSANNGRSWSVPCTTY